MDTKNTRDFKYTFMVIPFKFKGNINSDLIIEKSYFKSCDHNRIQYDRLYKHVADSITENNPDRTIYDFWVDRDVKFPELFRKTLKFKVQTDNNKIFETSAYLKDIFVYCFQNGIGFIVLNFVFDEDIDINTMCEILNKLKKIKREIDDSKFEISLNGSTVDLFSIINELPQGLNVDYDLFFQHSNKEYVSAIMLNSFTYFMPQSKDQKEKLEEDILHQLECLKRSQGNSYGTLECDERKYIRAFKNMFWAFSTQGIANINYNDPEVGNINFLQKFYKNVKREYLLMTLIILNQEFTLLDYCQKFTCSIEDIHTIGELNRLYNFKIHGTFTTISHLEHYREFYSRYSEELGIQKILEEVNSKQNAIYLSNKNKLTEEKAKRDKKINRFTKVLSVILSIFGITGLINNVATLLTRENAFLMSIIVVLVIVFAVILIIALSVISDYRFKRKSEHKKKKK